MFFQSQWTFCFYYYCILLYCCILFHPAYSIQHIINIIHSSPSCLFLLTCIYLLDCFRFGLIPIDGHQCDNSSKEGQPLPDGIIIGYNNMKVQNKYIIQNNAQTSDSLDQNPPAKQHKNGDPQTQVGNFLDPLEQELVDVGAWGEVFVDVVCRVYLESFLLSLCEHCYVQVVVYAGDQEEFYQQGFCGHYCMYVFVYVCRVYIL